MAMRAAMATEIGMTSRAEDRLTATRTVRVCSVAYATEERASEEKTGRARIFGSSVCSSRRLAIRRPTRTRLNRSMEVS